MSYFLLQVAGEVVVGLVNLSMNVSPDVLLQAQLMNNCCSRYTIGPEILLLYFSKLNLFSKDFKGTGEYNCQPTHVWLLPFEFHFKKCSSSRLQGDLQKWEGNQLWEWISLEESDDKCLIGLRGNPIRGEDDDDDCFFFRGAVMNESHGSLNQS